MLSRTSPASFCKGRPRPSILRLDLPSHLNTLREGAQTGPLNGRDVHGAPYYGGYYGAYPMAMTMDTHIRLTRIPATILPIHNIDPTEPTIDLIGPMPAYYIDPVCAPITIGACTATGSAITIGTLVAQNNKPPRPQQLGSFRFAFSIALAYAACVNLRSKPAIQRTEVPAGPRLDKRRTERIQSRSICHSGCIFLCRYE